MVASGVENEDRNAHDATIANIDQLAAEGKFGFTVERNFDGDAGNRHQCPQKQRCSGEELFQKLDHSASRT